jgi:hypothetical protein
VAVFENENGRGLDGAVIPRTAGYAAVSGAREAIRRNSSMRWRT